jgi:mono/diheme cytochrome c family protein
MRADLMALSKFELMQVKAPIALDTKQINSGRLTTKRADVMEMSVLRSLAACGALIAFSACASAQGTDGGKAEYRSNCAACHGIDGKGNGPVSKELKTRPTDLTILARKNDGAFPLNAVSKVIDGREPVGSHGTREMPIWGYRLVPPEHYILKDADDYLYLPPASPEAVVRGRILSIIDYLNRIQEK